MFKFNFAHDDLPVELSIDIDSIYYKVLLQYNNLNDFYTLTFKNQNGEILHSNVLRVSRDAMMSCKDFNKKIIPFSFSDFIKDLNQETKNKIELVVL